MLHTNNKRMKRALAFCSMTALFGVLSGCNSDSDAEPVDTVLNAPPSDCMWVGPYVKENEGFNFAYPDSGAVYWSTAYILPDDGSYLTFDGEFPYSRYMSFNSYRVNTTAVQSLTDRDIVAASGSINPFIEGNLRNEPNRAYQIKVTPGLPPLNADEIAANTLYDGTTVNGQSVLLLYRNYVPNEGRDQTGGVGLPRVTLHKADGTTLQGDAACEALGVATQPVDVPLIPAQAYKLHRDVASPAGIPANFRGNYGIPFLLRCDFLGDCSNNPPRSTNFYPNVDNQYVYGFLDRNHGDVAVIRGRIPQTTQTLAGQDYFASGELRYWSLCQNEFYSQKVEGCLYDEQVNINPDGFYTIVTSVAGDRPDNAIEQCGVGFIPWPKNGDGFGIIDGQTDATNLSLLIMRHMLPADDFHQTVKNTEISGDEASVMGQYLPKAIYMSREEFEQLGCDAYAMLPYEQM